MTSLCYRIRMKNFWLVKQEPSSYPWSDFIAEGQTSWTGVRNYTARNNLRRMEKVYAITLPETTFAEWRRAMKSFSITAA